MIISKKELEQYKDFLEKMNEHFDLYIKENSHFFQQEGSNEFDIYNSINSSLITIIKRLERLL